MILNLTEKSSIFWGGSDCASGEHGFSLIELMIALVVIALLSAIAVPAYRSSVEQGHRLAARTELMQLAEQLSRLALQSTTGRLPQEVVFQSDQLVSEKNEFYRFSVKIVDNGFGYWLVASPVKERQMMRDGAQALSHTGEGCWYRMNDDPMVNEPCSNEHYEHW